MKKEGTLRGPGAFRQLYVSSQRLDAELVRCFFILQHTKGHVPLRAGFAVPSKAYNAVRRNRLRRLMREAFASERESIVSALQGSQTSAVLLFAFRGGQGIRIDRLMLHHVHADIAMLCRAVAAKL